MEIALTIANHLQPLADALVFLNTTKVHPVWFPFPLASTFHAARVSMVYQANARRSPSPLSWGTYMTGYLLVAWGGGLLSHFLLGLPPSMFYSFNPTINYLTVHLIVTALFNSFPELLNPQILDTIFWPLDALLRTNSVALTLGHLNLPNIHPEYAKSPFAHMLLGAIVSCGGGLVGGTLSVWTPNWTFTTPPYLRAGAGWFGTLDIWGGALVAFIYSATTGHPAFASFSTYVNLLFSSPFLPISRKPHADADFPPVSTLGAKSIAAAVLGLLFAARVLKTHWLTPVLAEAQPSRTLVETQVATKPATVAKKPRKKQQ